MPPLPSRKSLEAMKRVELQRICKDYGVRANLKSEALIDLLLDTQSAPPPPMRRSVSTRQPSSKAGPSRVSSMIIHDVDEDEEQDENSTQPEDTKEPTPAPPPSIIPVPRTRKAKEMQIRLGVGKPHAAGGQGPRAVTRSSGSSKGRGLKASRSIKPMEATIEEEPEPLNIPSTAIDAETSKTETPPHNLRSTSISNDTVVNSSTIKKIIEDAMRPLEEQITLLKAEVTQIQTIKYEVVTLQTEVVEVKKAQETAKTEFQSFRDLSTVVTALKEEIKQLREGSSANSTPPQPSTPKSHSVQPPEAPSGFGIPSAFKAPATEPSPTRAKAGARHNAATTLPPHPGIAESTLGKRHRDSMASNITGIIEEGQEDEYSETELVKKVLRPTKKKPRMDKGKDEDETSNTAQASTSRQASLHTATATERHREASELNAMHTFTVYRGTDEDYIDPPPPSTHLPDFFRTDSPPPSDIHLPRPKSRAAGIPTSSANAAENQPQHVFGFEFLPVSSTPNQDPMYMPSFPYPEPPQSPSPAGSSNLGAFIGGRHDEQRHDIFRPYGLPSPIRSTRNYGALTQDDRGVNPAALTQSASTKQRREPSSTASTDAGAVPSSDSVAGVNPADPPLTSKRTMYGTELDSDTRFGDFGLEGMATSYWASGKF